MSMEGVGHVAVFPRNEIPLPPPALVRVCDLRITAPRHTPLDVAIADGVPGIVAVVPDADGDRCPDLIVGAASADGPAGLDVGRVYVVSGGLVPGGRSLVGGFFRNVNGNARDGLAALGPSDMIFVDGGGDRTCVAE